MKEVEKENKIKTKLIPTEYELLANPTHDSDAMILTGFRAIDIGYKCPKCKSDRVVTWLFPEQHLIYFDKCCKQIVYFKGYEGEEE